MPRLGAGIPLVGRRAELATLGTALDRAAAGRAAGVLLAGEAGVGKSRLVAETAQQASAAGFTVLTGRCLDAAESALPYLPFAEVAGRLAAHRPALLDAHPELRRLLPGGPATPADGERELGQLRMFDATLRALGELGVETPVLLVIEDVHWADRSSRDLLVFLLSRLAGQRLLVLVTYRGDDLHRRHPLRPVLSELMRLPAVERVELAPLGPADTVTLVERLADGTLDRAVVANVARRSEGNAFFAEELVSCCADGLPSGLVEVLLARVERLPAATQHVLRLAAVAGRRVRHDRLAALAGLPVAELEQALRDAAAHHVLIADEGPQATAVPGGWYAFRHALLQEAIHHELLPGERARMHAAYAELLAGHADEPGVAAELAHHAMAAHDLPRALAASVRAADEAAARAAPAELLRHAERALELWRAVPDAARVAGVDEAALTRRAGWAASATGEVDRGIALTRRALELAERAGDAVVTAEVARDYALRLLDQVGREDEALEVAHRAVELAAGPPGAAPAWAHAVVARVHYRVDRFAEAEHHAERALAVARALPAADRSAAGAAADALVTLGGCDEYGGRPARARARFAEATALARRSGDLGVELRAHFAVGTSLLDAGLLAEAGAEFAAGEARAEATGLTWSTYGLELRLSHVIARFMRGEWAAAETAVAPVGGVSATVASRLAAAGLLPAVARGRFAEAERRHDELVAAAIADDRVVLLLGNAGAESALWQGRPLVAVERVGRALAGLAAVAPHHLAGIAIAALGIAAHAAHAAAEPAAAPAAREQAAALLAGAEAAARHGLPRGGALGPEGRAWLLRARAELTRLTGPDPAAWAAVAQAFAYEGAPPGALCGYRVAYARWRRAEALLATAGGPADTAADLRDALAAADALGAAPLAAAVRVLAARAGVAAGQVPGPRAADPFTPRERAVLTQVARGLTNRQIGTELYISEKTVSVHLSRVMGKLGAGSRTEAVALAFERGLLTPDPAPTEA